MASNTEALGESNYVRSVRARAAQESLWARPTSRASTEQIIGQGSERKLIGSIDFKDEREGSGIGLMDPRSDGSQIEKEAEQIYQRLVEDFKPDLFQEHIIDSVDRVVRRVSGMLKPEHLYATTYVTAMEIPRILRLFY
jgi:hypothetical protein